VRVGGKTREMDDVELVAQQVSVLRGRVESMAARLDELASVIARLELAALTTARSLQKVSDQWDAVYEAMRRSDEAEAAAAAQRAPDS
jgi:hypothetical protein